MSAIKDVVLRINNPDVVSTVINAFMTVMYCDEPVSSVVNH